VSINTSNHERLPESEQPPFTVVVKQNNQIKAFKVESSALFSWFAPKQWEECVTWTQDPRITPMDGAKEWGPAERGLAVLDMDAKVSYSLLNEGHLGMGRFLSQENGDNPYQLFAQALEGQTKLRPSSTALETLRSAWVELANEPSQWKHVSIQAETKTSPGMLDMVTPSRPLVKKGSQSLSLKKLLSRRNWDRASFEVKARWLMTRKGSQLNTNGPDLWIEGVELKPKGWVIQKPAIKKEWLYVLEMFEAIRNWERCSHIDWKNYLSNLCVQEGRKSLSASASWGELVDELNVLMGVKKVPASEQLKIQESMEDWRSLETPAAPDVSGGRRLNPK